MTVEHTRPRTEHRFRRPFKRLLDLETAFEEMAVDFDWRVESVKGVLPNGSLLLPTDFFAELKFYIHLFSDVTKIRKELKKAGIPCEQVEVVIWANGPRGSFLGQAEVLTRFTLDKCLEEYNFSPSHPTRPPVTKNNGQGFDLTVTALLKQDLSFDKKHLGRPSEFGMILAESVFQIRPENDFDDLKPIPLTDELRGKDHLNLPDKSWIHVQVSEGLHETNSLKSAVRIYIDENLLEIADAQKAATTKIMEGIFIIPVVTQLANQLSMDLKDDEGFDWDGTGSAALTFFQSRVKVATGKTIERSVLVRKLRDNPSWVASVVLSGANFNIRKTFTDFFGEREDKNTNEGEN